jgi:hypothetical protein
MNNKLKNLIIFLGAILLGILLGSQSYIFNKKEIKLLCCLFE